MSFFLSKKERLAWEKQQLAAAVRRQRSVDKALKEVEMQQALDRRKSAWTKYQNLESQLNRELEKQRNRLLPKDISPEGLLMRLPGVKNSCDIGKNESFEISPDKDFQSNFPYPSSLETATQRADKLLVCSYDPSPECKKQRLRVLRSRGKSEAGHLPPPSVPYSTSRGEVMSVHILRSLRPKSDLKGGNEARRDAFETQNGLNQDRGKSLSRANSISDSASTPLAQFHVFRDISLDSYVLYRGKVDYERRAWQIRMKAYSERVSKEYPPVLDERKRLQLKLVEERKSERGLRRRYNRVGLRALLQHGK
jgi:hypothetical protein